MRSAFAAACALLLLAASAMPARAVVVIYRCTDASGAVTVQNDTPCPKGSKQKVQEVEAPTVIPGYTAERGIDQLVWYEPHQYIDQAILREKRIKRWLRDWKFALVEKDNPQWLDLYGALRAKAEPGSAAPTGPG